MKLKEKYWHEFFVVAICIKSFTGIVETLGGFLILFMSPNVMGTILNKLSRGELTEIPADFIFGYINQSLHHLTVANKVFAGLYVLAHGLINLFIVYGLLKNKPAAYLVGIGILIAFIAYQVSRFLMNRSPLLGLLTIFDVFFIILIYHEYKYLIHKLKKQYEQS